MKGTSHKRHIVGMSRTLVDRINRVPGLVYHQYGAGTTTYINNTQLHASVAECARLWLAITVIVAGLGVSIALL